MKIHEFQAKQILRDAGVAVLPGQVARTAQEAADAYRELGSGVAVVKAQIHAGGRGKGTVLGDPGQHGVQLVRSAEEAGEVAGRLLGRKLVTIQTGPAGHTIRQVLIEQGCQIARELYLGIVLDRAAARPALMVSSEGGVDIEKVAAETPALIFKEHFDPALGLQSYQVRKLCTKLGLSGAAVRSADKFMKAVCRVFVQCDCSLAEINPLVVTTAGELVALDAKINLDDNGLFRHPEIAALRDLDEEEPAEVRAAKAGLSYVKLDGNIGCLVNGAGLAMSTMDLIKLHGGEPANFLDVGGRRHPTSHRGLSHPVGGSQRDRCAGQYIRRDRALHHDRHRAARGFQAGRIQHTAGGAAGGDRGGRGATDSRRQRSGYHYRRQPHRCCAEDCGCHAGRLNCPGSVLDWPGLTFRGLIIGA